jgi:hypothetical protein
LALKINMSFSPVVVRTETTSSPSVNLIAIRVWLRVSYSRKNVFFAVPNRVTITRKRDVS